MSTHFKVVKDEVAYYVYNVNAIGLAMALTKTDFSISHTLLQFSEFAVNIRTNEVIKARQQLEAIFDSFTGCE